MGEKISENIYKYGISQEKLPENRTDLERFEDAKKFGVLKVFSLIQSIRDTFGGKLPTDILSRTEIFDRKKIEDEAYEYMLQEWKRDNLIVPDEFSVKLRIIATGFVQKQIDIIDDESNSLKSNTLSKRTQVTQGIPGMLGWPSL